jgi:plastocyanin
VKSLAVPLLAVMSLGLVACSAGNRTASAAPARTTQVDLPPSYVFQPAVVEVAHGSTVTWTNHDNFTHSVLVQGQSDVHMMKPGEAAQITFDQPGRYDYVCTLHTQNMRGTVIVD